VGETLPKPILDDPEATRKIDKSKMLAFCTQAADHYRKSALNAQKIKLNYPAPENVVIAGMGGSAIGGEIAKDFIRATSRVPVEVSREYNLPAYVNEKTLVVLASYSGDTEETLSSFLDALNRKCMVYCLSSGGNLIKYAHRLNVPCMQVQADMPPRAALPHMLMPLLKIMEQNHLVPSFSRDFSEATRLLEKVSVKNAPEKTTEENPAKTLAQHLLGVSPAIYGWGIYRGVALRYKQQFNENAKVPAKWDAFSELNHNETMGWEKPEALSKSFGVVFLRDEAEPAEIRSRIETTMKLMYPAVPKMFEVWAQGKSTLARMLSTILVGDFASVYLAMLRGVDPTPVDTVSVMKEKIERNGVKQRILRELEEIAVHS
jgi:glucose/mannose-6-phosphate isomerase